MSDTSHPLEGTVIRATGSRYIVQTAHGPVSCTIRGRFRLEGADATNPVVIGDRVEIQELDNESAGVITAIHSRENRLTRRAAGRRVGREHLFAANIDAAWVVQSVQKPKLNPGLIDRFLVMAEAWEIDAGIVINKMDLVDGRSERAIAFWTDLYSNLGYEVLQTSIVSGYGVVELKGHLAGKTSVLIGPSGTGKSSLINAAQPDASLQTGEVSAHTSKGKHTTTFGELVPLSSGGYIGDTPGIREYGLVDIEPAELGHFFVEFRPYLGECRFPNCTHDHEPDCRIADLVEEEMISPERYHSYLSMLGSIHLGDKDVGR